MTQQFHEVRAAMIASCVRNGDHVRHVDYGAAIVTKVSKKTGIITIMLPEGIEGTTTIDSLRRAT